MCRNFTYEGVGQRRRLKAIKKIVPQKLNIILFFDIEFFKYFFRVLHEASSSWLKFCRGFQGHCIVMDFCSLFLLRIYLYRCINISI
jgi:hypothetical protein